MDNFSKEYPVYSERMHQLSNITKYLLWRDMIDISFYIAKHYHIEIGGEPEFDSIYEEFKQLKIV